MLSYKTGTQKWLSIGKMPLQALINFQPCSYNVLKNMVWRIQPTLLNHRWLNARIIYAIDTAKYLVNIWYRPI